ncbi:GNAT family N-acetyltransferase [Kutzneria buriramensis]|uniref:Acetyltransferase (GNAT) family protein n=1 Tax=Kutzneria buriramensis TaxID=1045776 RepID=A0A3E0HPR8_9PSEU|nr:GNAT family N-acetyltransferase [Kutzneria buriramensis]REH48381.1 acetyltransferase (GNAT) family protein [Kutzneria buriramensis]
MDTAAIARLGIDDLAACLDLAADRGWPRDHRKWTFLLTHGEAYGLHDREDLVGSAILSRFGPRLAWIGMVLVAQRCDRRGLGGALMRHALDAADARTVAVHATDAGVPLYRRLGFRATGTIFTHRGRFAGHGARTGRTRPFTGADLDAVRRLDADATGADRGRLLTEFVRFAGQMRVIESDGVITGYAGSWRDGETVVIGPVIAASDRDAKDLIADVASTVDGYVRLDVDRSDLADWAAARGLPRWLEATEMVRGEDMPGDRTRLYTPIMQALG